MHHEEELLRRTLNGVKSAKTCGTAPHERVTATGAGALVCVERGVRALAWRMHCVLQTMELGIDCG